MDDATGDLHYVTHQFDNSAAICRCIWICYQCMLYNDIHLDRECLRHANKRSALPSNLSYVSYIRRQYHCWSLRCSWSIASRRCSNDIFNFDLTPGPRFNIKISSYQYRKSHWGDKMVVRSSYLHNGISYTGQVTSLCWIRALASMDWAKLTVRRGKEHLSLVIWCGL